MPEPAHDWDIFLGPPERTKVKTGGADQWVLKRRELSGLARVNKVTSTSLGYPLSVFNKNSILSSKAKKNKKAGNLSHSGGFRKFLGNSVPKKSFYYSGPSLMRPNKLWTCTDTEPPGLAPGCS